MNINAEEHVSYHFNYAFIDSPKLFGKVRLFQMGDIVCNNVHEIKEHAQRCFELTCVLNGKVDCYCNSVPFTIQKNMVFLSLPNEKHRIKINDSDGARFLFLGFDVLADHPLYNELEILLKTGTQIKRVFQNQHTVFETMTKCLQEISSFNSYSEILIESYLNEIIALVIKTLNDNTTKRYNIKDKDLLLANLIFYIENNISEIKGISDICKHFNFSESYLSHLFSQKVSVSIYKYLSNVKLQKALLLLKQGDSITKVAESLNYTSIYIFSRAFKNRFGVAPTHYLRSANQDLNK